MRTTYRYTVYDENGNIVLHNTGHAEVVKHFNIHKYTNLKKYTTEGILLKGRYRVVISGVDKNDRVQTERLAQCYKFTAQMLAEWDYMNRKYGRC